MRFLWLLAKKDNGYINSICLNKIEIGRVDSKDISNEFILLESEFEKLKEKSGIETKVYDELKLEILNYKG